ncbi:alpha-mannosidase I MNS5, partial [Tanacetum coccineum]
VLAGDVAAANLTHREFFYVWKKFGVLPERYLLDHQMVHPTEKYYPLRPELAESTYYLYQATKEIILSLQDSAGLSFISKSFRVCLAKVTVAGTGDGALIEVKTLLRPCDGSHGIGQDDDNMTHAVDPWYMEVGEAIVNSLNLHTKVDGGFASVRDVTTMQLEDHQHSFFLAETCKYLYLLFDDSPLIGHNYVFTTEGHPLPVNSDWHERLPGSYIPSNWTSIKIATQKIHASAMSMQVCPANLLTPGRDGQPIESVCHVPDTRDDHRCLTDDDCGIDSTNCRRRSCSMAGYC